MEDGNRTAHYDTDVIVILKISSVLCSETNADEDPAGRRTECGGAQLVPERKTRISKSSKEITDDDVLHIIARTM